ncbi:MAG TPA: DUF3313 family protein [Myxococcota bacterium]|nr:DUF3313 family protein [Myxococcota bacterium]
MARKRELLAALAAIALAGCTSVRGLEAASIGARPAPDAGFLPAPDRMSPHAHAPFDRSWLAPGVDLRDYSKVWVAPVDTAHVLPLSLWDRLNLRAPAVASDLPRLARELHDDVVQAFSDDPQHRFEVLGGPLAVDGQSVVLEIALTELVPNKPVVGLVGLAAWAGPLQIGIPVATAAAFLQQGEVAFELRARDGASRAVIAMAADRETGPMRVIDFRALTWYGNAHEIFRAWAREMVEVADTPLDRPVPHASYFTLLPW